MKKKNIFFVLLICFINSSCNKEEQTDELQDKDFYSDVTTRASYISGTITGEMNPYVSDGYYTYDLSIPIQKQSVGIRISAVGGEARPNSTDVPPAMYISMANSRLSPWKGVYSAMLP